MFVYTGGQVPEHLRRHLTHARIDKSVTEIDNEAFDGCEHLLDVDCHSGVRRVNVAAFSCCRSLGSINLPGVTFIDEQAFDSCRSLREVNFGNKLETIEMWAFEECHELTHIKMPFIRTIGAYAFFQCTNLKEAEFGEGLETIGLGAFQNCESLSRIVIPLKYDLFTLHHYGLYDQFDNCDELATVELVGGIHKTISYLSLQIWRNEMDQEIDRINQVLPTTRIRRKTWVIREWIGTVLQKIEYYKAEHCNLLKEAMTLLELAVWKAKVRQNEEEEHSPFECNKAKKVKIDVEGARNRHRVTCGADIIIKNVLPFLELS